ncbi:MAG: AAA family ATPase [bacterium]
MKIKSINLKNFRQFISTPDIEFSYDDDKCYTIILGDNTFGKTTLVKGFIWCLYQEEKLFEDNNLLSANIRTSMKIGEEEEVSVTVKIEHNSIDYKIKTTCIYQKIDEENFNNFKPKTIVYKSLPDMGTISLHASDATMEINNILNNDLKEYFFFDGEKNKINDIVKKSTLKNAVSKMLGLSVTEKLMDYFHPRNSQSVVRVLESGYSADDYNNIAIITECDRIIMDNTAEIETKKYTNNLYNEEIEKFKEDIAKNEQTLDANKNLILNQNRKKEIDKENNNLIQRIDSKYSSMINSINYKSSLLNSLFAKAYVKYDVEDYLKSSSFSKGKGFTDINEAAVDQIIESGVCLCGTCLRSNPSLINVLLEAKNHMEPNNYSQYIENFITENFHNCQRANSLHNDLTDNIDALLDSWEQFNKNDEELSEIKRLISGKDDVGYIQDQIDEWKIQIGLKSKSIEHNENTVIPNCDREIQVAEKKRDKALENSSSNQLIKRSVTYAKSIYNSLNKGYEERKEQKRQILESKVDSIFKDMYRGEDSVIKIDENYNVSTLYKGKNLNGSTGAMTVKNFSFVAGLMSLLKEQEKSEDMLEEVVDGNYPLVMDAPFSSLDDTHINNISRELPKYCKQVIIVVMEKDYSKAKIQMGNQIGKVYKINKISEIEAEIQEVK